MLSRVLGYVRQRAIAYYIGNGWAADALSVAQRVPNIIRSLLAEGTLSASFIPVYAALNARPDKGAARALAGAILGLLLLATGVLALIGIAFAPALTAVFGAGLTGDARALAVSLMRLLFPMSGLMVVSAWCLGVLNTHRRFFLPYAAPAVWNIAGIVALVAAGTWLVAPSVAAVSLPGLSRDAQGSTPSEQLRARIAVGFRRIVFFILPSSLGFVALAPVIVRPLFQTGRFGAADTDLVGGVVAAYGVGLLGQACVKLFQSGFYALRDTKTPVKIASASLVLSSALAYLLMRRFGPAGIALGSSLGATVNVVFHLRDLDARVGAILGGTEWRAFAVSLLVSGAAAAAGLETARIAAGWGAFAAALFALVIFGAVYFGGTIALRHPDARRLWTFLR